MERLLQSATQPIAIESVSMKFTISVKEFLNQLNKIAGAVASSTVIPILEDFLLDLQDDVLTITASDYETFMRIRVSLSNSEGNGRIAIPAKILIDTLRALPEQPITLAVDGQGVSLASSSGTYKLNGEDAADYPDLPLIESDESQIEFGSDVLQNAISKTLFGVSNDELRPAMTGVFMRVDEDSMTFVATDAHKLVRYKSFEPTGIQREGIILPKKALNLVKNALSDQTTIVKMRFNETNAQFEFDNLVLVCRLIDARYPDYNAVIPKENPNKLTINRTDLQSALRRLAIYANKSTYQVIFDIQAGQIEVSAQDIDFSNEARETLPCDYSGESIRIAFNAKFLIEILGVLDTDEISLELSTPSRAGIIIPSEENDNEDVLMLVMPIMINNN